jgi:hypothetical protein
LEGTFQSLVLTNLANTQPPILSAYCLLTKTTITAAYLKSRLLLSPRLAISPRFTYAAAAIIISAFLASVRSVVATVNRIVHKMTMTSGQKSYVTKLRMTIGTSNKALASARTMVLTTLTIRTP